MRLGARLLPLTHVVSLVRPLLIGQSPPHPLTDLAVLTVYTLLAGTGALVLFVRRFER